MDDAPMSPKWFHIQSETTEISCGNRHPAVSDSRTPAATAIAKQRPMHGLYVCTWVPQYVSLPSAQQLTSHETQGGSEERREEGRGDDAQQAKESERKTTLLAL